jgi:predicted enzyme related to lactoylglutathione lyase
MAASLSLHEITVDCVDVEAVATFWAAVLGTELREPLPGWRRLGPMTEGGPVLNFQPVPEPKQGKNRMHLDLRTDDIDDAVLTVTRLGGRHAGERHDYDEGVVLVMTDPEGNEFCLVQYS